MNDVRPPEPPRPPVDDSSAIAAQAKREKIARWLNGLIERHRDEPDQLQIVTMFCINCKAWPQLARTCDLILAHDPSSSGAHRLKAMAILAAADESDTDRAEARRLAVAELEAALCLAPNHVSALADLAALHLRARNPRAAVPLLERAIREQPLLAPLHFNLALAHAQMREFDQGIAALRFAIHLDPSDANYHTQLGCMLGDSRRFEEAIEACRYALVIAPRHHPALHNLGEFQFNLGRHAEAETSLRRALTIVEHPQTLFFLAATLTRMGRAGEAEALATKLQAVAPNLAHDLRALMASHVTTLPERQEVA